MGRRPKGLFATLRESLRTWWRSKNADSPEEEETDPGPDEDGHSPAVTRKKVFVQSLPQEAALSLTARGDVYAFEVFPTFRWSSKAMSRETLKTRVRQHEETAREELLRVAWATARACEPDEPVAAELAVNRRLATDGNWCFDDAQGLIRCTPSVRVRVDPALRDHVREHHEHALTLKQTRELGLLRAERAQALTEAWLKVISDLELLGELDAHQRRLLVPFAATLADQDFRKVMEALRAQRHTSTEALVEALRGARGDHQAAGMYEFASAYDKALSAFCREMGLSPFSWVEDAVAADGPTL